MPGDGWHGGRRQHPAVRAGAEGAALARAPFGLGLRLSARDARELLDGGRLDEFRAFLDDARPLRRADQRLPVRLVPPHAGQGRRLRAGLARRRAGRVHARSDRDPRDACCPRGWTAASRRRRSPTSRGCRPRRRRDCGAMTRNVVRVAEALVRGASAITAAFIHLDIEPEPDCLLETSDETIDFFERWLLPVGGAAARAALGRDLGRGPARAARARPASASTAATSLSSTKIPRAALDRSAARRHPGRTRATQLGDRGRRSRPTRPRAPSAGRAAAAVRRLDLPAPGRSSARRATLTHFPDLDDALDRPRMRRPAREWRIHFHVPLFTQRLRRPRLDAGLRRGA